MKPTSNFFYSVLLTSSVIFASAWFFCSSTLMILSDFNFSADHTQFDVQKQTVQLNREKGLTVVSISVENIFMVFIQFYFCLLLVLWLCFFPLWLLKFLLHACAAGTSSALYSFICSYSGSGISAVSIDFCHFLFVLWAFFVDTVSICTVIFADVSNLSRFTSTVFIDCYFFLLLFTLFLLIFPAVYLSCAVVSNVSTYVWLCCFYYFYLYFILLLLIVL